MISAHNQSQQRAETLRHALLPWRISHTDGSNYALEIVTTNERGNEELVCRPPGKKRDGNAALIVEAVNSHEGLKARIQELETALRFYADGRRYQGANQKPIADDPYAKPDAVYINDVTRDLGAIARAALSKGAA